MVPHALLLTGTGGVGKQHAAGAFAMALNCLAPKDPDESNSKIAFSGTESCGTCRSCRKILAGSHPDIIHIRPKGVFIRIDQIRSLLATLAMKPYEAKYRVVIIKDAHTMNPEAGNALLKMLEEPPDRTVLILLSRQPAELLPTVVSRCRHIRFNPISREKLAQTLMNKADLAYESALSLAALSQGSLSQALEMSREKWLNKRMWIIASLGLDQTERMASQPIRILLAFSEMLAKKKERVEMSLEIIKTWLRDILIYPYDPDMVINIDLLDHVKEIAAKADRPHTVKQYTAVMRALNALRSNANLRLTLDVMVLQFADQK